MISPYSSRVGMLIWSRMPCRRRGWFRTWFSLVWQWRVLCPEVFMRWLFLLLLVLNVFYYVWHQQEAPLRAKDVTPLNLYRGSQQDIRLLSEAAGEGRRDGVAPRQQCLFLGGFSDEDSIVRLQQRLVAMKVKVQSLPKDAAGSGYWL